MAPEPPSPYGQADSVFCLLLSSSGNAGLRFGLLASCIWFPCVLLALKGLGFPLVTWMAGWASKTEDASHPTPYQRAKRLETKGCEVSRSTGDQGPTCAEPPALHEY